MAHEFRMPDIGEGLTEAEIVLWLVSVGDRVTVGQPVVEVETAKTTVEIPATHAGVVSELRGDPGDTVEVGEVLFVVGDDADDDRHTDRDATAAASADASVAGAPESAASGDGAADPGGAVRAMPVVRRLARERGVDLSTITGTGPGGSITREDVLAAGEATGAPRTGLSATRRAIAAHMSESWRTIPHVTVQAEIRAERLLERRTDRNGESIPLEAIVAEAVVPLLRRHPWFNATFDDGDVVVHESVHLGFAVDTAAGLMVVVVRDADQRSVGDIGDEFARLAGAAADRTIGADQVVGQTFTISNIGALGGGHGTPIIPLGTSAILSVGRARRQPVVEDGELSVGLVAPIDLSYDHRLIDGGLGQRFLSELVTALEA